MRYLIFLAALSLSAANIPPGLQTYTVCSSGCTYSVSQGLDAVNAAITQAGMDGLPKLVTLAAGGGAETVDAFTLPTRSRNAPWIFLASANHVACPAWGVRIATNDANLALVSGSMKIDADATAGPVATLNANHYWLECINFDYGSGTHLDTISMDPYPGSGRINRPGIWPSNITFSHIYVTVGSFTTSVRNGMFLSGENLMILDSYINGGHTTQESHTIAGINMGCNVLLQNNTVRGLGTSINVLFGGSSSVQAGTNVCNLRVIGNWFLKPFKNRFTSGAGNPTRQCWTDLEDGNGEWYRNTSDDSRWQCQGTTGQAPIGGSWTSVSSGTYNAADDYSTYIKNNFELKSADGCQIEGNIFDGGNGNGYQSQHGAAILFNQADVSENLHVITGCVIRNNIMRNSGQGIANGRANSIYTSHRNTNARVYNNIFWNVGSENLMLSATNAFKLFQVGGHMGGGQTAYPMASSVFYNNTSIDTSDGATYAQYMFTIDTSANSNRMSFYNNIVEGKPVYNNADGGGDVWTAIQNSWTSASNLNFARNLFPARLDQTYGGYKYQPSTLFRAYADGSLNTGSMMGWSNQPPAYTRDLTTWYGPSAVFTDKSTGDLTLQSAYQGHGLLGSDAGARINEVLAATGCATPITMSCSVTTGTLANFLRYFNPPMVRVGTTTIDLSYNSPVASQQCTILYGNFGNLAGASSATDTAGTFKRTKQLTGLTSGKPYFLRVTCGTGIERNIGPFYTN